MSYAFNSPCQRAPLPSYKGPMNFWVLKVALQRLPCPRDVTGPKTGRHMKARVRMMGAGWHRAWSLLIWSWTWFDTLYFHVRNLQRLRAEKLFKASEATLDSWDTEVLFFLLKYIHVLKFMSCVRFMKKGVLKYQHKKRSKVVVLIDDLFSFAPPLSVSLCPLACKKSRDEPELVDRCRSSGGRAPWLSGNRQTVCHINVPLIQTLLLRIACTIISMRIT